MTNWLVTYGDGDFDEGVSYETDDKGLRDLIDRTTRMPGLMADGSDYIVIRKANYLVTKTVANPKRTRQMNISAGGDVFASGGNLTVIRGGRA
jgi:hypothetical protein